MSIKKELLLRAPLFLYLISYKCFILHRLLSSASDAYELCITAHAITAIMHNAAVIIPTIAKALTTPSAGNTRHAKIIKAIEKTYV